MELLARLRRLAEENRYTVIVVTHELGLAAEFADQVVLMHRGKCLRVGTPAEVYQRELLEQVFEAPLEIETGPEGRPRVHCARQRTAAVGFRITVRLNAPCLFYSARWRCKRPPRGFAARTFIAMPRNLEHSPRTPRSGRR